MEYKIYKDINLIVCKPKANHSFEELLESVKVSFADPDFDHKLNAIYDFSNVDDITGDIRALFELSDTMQDQSIVSVPSKLAIIVKHLDHKLYGLIDSYRTMASESLVETRVFIESKYKEALEFLCVDAIPE